VDILLRGAGAVHEHSCTHNQNGKVKGGVSKNKRNSFLHLAAEKIYSCMAPLQ